jgi:CubicO group peptidase (beta-lactamase class C family)
MIRRSWSAVPVLLASLASSITTADEIDDAVASSMASSKVPGLTLAVARGGEIVKLKAYGLANVELDAPAGEETIYEIGSITKSFTATVVMDLVEEGKIDLDAPIETYLSDLPEAWKRVTVRHLLTHTSGIPSYTGVGDFVKMARTEYRPPQILALVAEKPMEFQPGEKWAYCNTGYYLLGLIVEKVAGAPFARVLSERVLEPLEMRHTRPSAPTAIIPRRSAGYSRMLGVLFNRDPLSPTAAYSAGFLVSDVKDMLKWAEAQQADTILTEESRRQMTTAVKLNDGSTHPYGFGWSVGSRRGHRRIDHGGGTAGFSSFLSIYPDDGLRIAILSNQSGGADLGTIERAIARQYISDLDIAAAEAIEDSDPDATKRIREAVADLLDGDWDDAPFTADFAKFLRSDSVRGVVKAVGKEGELTELTLLRREAREKNTALEYRATFGKTRYLMRATLDLDGKLSGLLFEKDQ